jgi:adenosylcobinamide kinase/adenosylcobinamide-phosphate guanylyltransferase
VGGGARSGKSAFALTRAMALGSRRVFLATAECLDDEMRARVACHREERGAGFRTIEAPRQLLEALHGLEDVDVVLIDCLTLWLSNLLLDDEPTASIEARIAELVQWLVVRRCHTVIVTNEVGMGIVPDNALARRFRDLTGRAHQRLGAACDEVYLAALGQVIRLKPAPIAAAHETP